MCLYQYGLTGSCFRPEYNFIYFDDLSVLALGTLEAGFCGLVSDPRHCKSLLGFILKPIF